MSLVGKGLPLRRREAAIRPNRSAVTSVTGNNASRDWPETLPAPPGLLHIGSRVESRKEARRRRRRRQAPAPPGAHGRRCRRALETTPCTRWYRAEPSFPECRIDGFAGGDPGEKPFLVGRGPAAYESVQGIPDRCR